MRLGSGRELRVGRPLARGGEGEVFEVEQPAGVVFKRLHDARLQTKPHTRERLETMVRRRPARWREPGSSHVLLAWPSDLVFDGRRFVGFVMPRIDVTATAELHTVANPSDRRDPGRATPGWVKSFTWEYLLQTASNLALATQVLHDDDYVIGDFQERNILVSSDARITLVDCDSMQVKADDDQYFLTEIGRPEFTAPELLDVDLSTTIRRPSSDLFALAIHVYQLLMEGAHPFDGIWSGPGDKPKRHRLAQQGMFVNGGRQLAPHPIAMPFGLLPPTVRGLFIRAFVEGATNPDSRPTGEQWQNALEATAGTLNTCRSNKAHLYPSHHTACPWCAHVTKNRPPQTPLTPLTPPAVSPTPPRPPHRPPVAATQSIRPSTPIHRAGPGSTRPAKRRSWQIAVFAVAILGMLAILATRPDQESGDPPTAATTATTSRPATESGGDAPSPPTTVGGLPTHPPAAPTYDVTGGSESYSPARAESVRVVSASGTGHTLSVEVDATGEFAPEPNNSCIHIEGDDGTAYLALVSDVRLSVDQPGNYVGTLTFPALISGTYSFEYHCATGGDYSPAPLGRVTVPSFAVMRDDPGAWQSGMLNYAVILSTTDNSLTLAAHGDWGVPSPIGACMLNGDTCMPPDDTSIESNMEYSGNYAGTLTFNDVDRPATFQYSSGHPPVPIE